MYRATVTVIPRPELRRVGKWQPSSLRPFSIHRAGTYGRRMTCSVIGPVWADLYDQFQYVGNSYELF